MRKLTIIFTAFFVITLIGCGNTPSESASYGKAPDFTVTTIDGKSITLSDYTGKVMLLNFFATWCPPCRMEMPDFNEIAAEYAENVQVIAINVGREPVSKVKEFVKEQGLIFPVAMDDGRIGNMYGPMPGIPVTVVINKDFDIEKRYIGMRSKEVFVGDINVLK